LSFLFNDNILFGDLNESREVRSFQRN